MSSYEKKDFDNAIAEFTDAVRLNPKNYLAFQERGRAWSRKNQYDNAIADYNAAIRLGYGDSDAYGGRG